MLFTLLQLSPDLTIYKIGILSFLSAFAVAIILMPLLLHLIKRFHLYDVPDTRKEHAAPVPTMGGIAVFLGMMVACLLWFGFTSSFFSFAFFFSLIILFIIGILDDLKDIPAVYKFLLQLSVSFLIAFSGVRISSFNGLLGIGELPTAMQYLFTVVVLTGITNAFNLIDGIDGLAGGLGFMSLMVLGIFLTLCNDSNTALVAFALAGALLGFLYFNFNPARIFMGDTGSLVLGFTIAVLCTRLLQVNTGTATPVLLHAPVFALSVVLIPIFDTVRVFTLRLSKGKSPFHPDKTHIHHLLTNNGWSHSFSAKLICTVHALILLLGFFSSSIRQEAGILLLFITMLLVTFTFKKLRQPAAEDRNVQLD